MISRVLISLAIIATPLLFCAEECRIELQSSQGKLQISIAERGATQAISLSSAAKIKRAAPQIPRSARSFTTSDGTFVAMLIFSASGETPDEDFSIGVVLACKDGVWRLDREWTAQSRGSESSDNGYMRQTLEFADVVKAGFTRRLHSLSIETVNFTLNCGCPACQSRTLEFVEDEVYAWNSESRKFDRKRYEKKYVVQYGENVLSVVRKGLGNAALIGRIFALNPDLKNADSLKQGQQVLIERYK